MLISVSLASNGSADVITSIFNSTVVNWTRYFSYTNTPNTDSLRCWAGQCTAGCLSCCLSWIPTYNEITASDLGCVRCTVTITSLCQYRNVLPMHMSHVRGSTVLKCFHKHSAVNASLLSGAAYYTFFPIVALRPNVDQVLLIHEVSRSHTTTQHSR